MTSIVHEAEALEDFRREVVAVNLRRIPWLLVASMLLALWPISMLWHDASSSWLRWALIVDTASAGLLLALNFRMRRLSPDSPWPSVYIWTVAFLALAYMDGYYFLVGQSFGANPIYILGVVTTATMFLLPPQRFLPLLFANHVVYCALLKTQAGPEAALLVVFIQNTTGATVAGLASILLYRVHRDEFFQRRALAAANCVLAKRNGELNDLMAITAHDLRSPLLGMRDLLVLADRAPPSGRLGEILGHVGRTCAELIALVDRLLDAHAAEEQAKKALPLVPCDVRGVVAAAVERARGRAEGRGITMDLQLPDGPAELPVNAPALGQVFDNLLSNAIKYSPPGGSVVTRLARVGGAWLCDVMDGGPGIPVAERATLFQKFHRGTNPLPAGEASSGLGLFIAATLMQAMGGRVDYLPVSPHGSLFRVVLGSSPESGAA
ncbi:MAG: HAMP domain-containing sensor histidine kinase [Reyranella sp.]|uniref:sensor histidine kinase n=1 Tax=Reyranella sp. TaxID=1929291 RepID=UPI00273001FE|nr:HAMP domain-containing sensor histidine kinase [Reyranella sp.]MDP1962128.1 HAMP domain-containing sensor histidine kinase [Reyranella sp.]MDP2374777.1 HAMP domain-containing sensor histidine kinase [Reyranella sp.]